MAGCEEKNTGNGKNEGNNGEQAVLFLDGSASETIEIGGESQTKNIAGCFVKGSRGKLRFHS